MSCLALGYHKFIQFFGFGPDVIFVKFIGNNYNNFQYQKGLNELKEPFDSSGICTGGGLYFTTLKNAYQYIDRGTDLAIIKLCEDAKFCIEHYDHQYKFKTDKFIITDIIKEVTPLTEKIFIEAVNDNYFNLEIINEKQTEKICIAAVRRNRKALQFVKNMTQKIREEADRVIDTRGQTYETSKNACQYIYCGTDPAIIELCEDDPSAEQYACDNHKNMGSQVCEIPIQYAETQTPEKLQYVKTQTLEICSEAKKNGSSIDTKKPISKSRQRYLLKQQLFK